MYRGLGCDSHEGVFLWPLAVRDLWLTVRWQQEWRNRLFALTLLMAYTRLVSGSMLLYVWARGNIDIISRRCLGVGGASRSAAWRTPGTYWGVSGDASPARNAT